MSLEKLKIIAYKSSGFGNSDKVDEFSVMINPKEYSRTHAIEYACTQGMGTSGTGPKYVRSKPEDLKLEFHIDGTGAIYNASTDDSVEDQIKKFKSLVFDYNGEIHSNNYLQLLWGSLTFKCVLEQFTVNYTMFKPNGSPLRAKVDATFKEFTDPDTEAKEANRKSPDVTHKRIIKEGDTLPNLCYEIYRDSSYYIEIAAANNLVNFRNLEPGTVIHFPSVKK